MDALQHLYSLVRTDWQNKLEQRSTIYGYLESLYNSHATLALGKTALQYMIVDRHSRGKFGEAITLAESARGRLSGVAEQENLVNLIFLYLHSGQTQSAQGVFDNSKQRTPTNGILASCCRIRLTI